MGKTGTSSIQYFFYNNRQELYEKYKVIYPDIGLQGEGHHALAVLDAPCMPEDVVPLYKELVQLYKHRAGYHILISSEVFCFLSSEYIKQISQILSECDVRIIFYVRQQCQLLESVFLQYVSVGENYKGDIHSFWKSKQDAFDFNKRIEPWESGFGAENIIARLYDRRLIADVCTNILALMGISVSVNGSGNENDFVRYNANRRILPEFVPLITKLDSVLLRHNVRAQVIEEILRLSDVFREYSTFHLVDDEFCEQIFNFYLHSNATFADRFLDEESRRFLLERERWRL
jgi:hypothetical protein